MAEPWFCREAPSEGPGWWETFDDVGVTYWPTEKLARRYAALPVLIATIRDATCLTWCRFCENESIVSGRIVHEADCPGIAALKAAGEEIE